MSRWLMHASRRIDFRGRQVLITGGSRGLGLVLARQFAAQGARLAICARDEEELERARADLVGRGADVRALVCDLTNAAQVRQVVRVIEADRGPIDVLVNNAGVIQVGPADAMTLDDYERAMRTHFWGPLYAMHSVLPSMRERRCGRIVNIASIGGKVSVPHLLPYSASKFALVGLSEGLRAELAKDNVFVTTVCPGLMRTGSPRNVTVKGRHRAEYALFVLSDSLPGISRNAVRAATRIVEACRYGEAEVVIGAPAKAAAWVHGLWPGMTSEALGVLNRLLPENTSNGHRARRGAESESAITDSPLTILTDRAAAENNEISPGDRSRPIADTRLQ